MKRYHVTVDGRCTQRAYFPREPARRVRGIRVTRHGELIIGVVTGSKSEWAGVTRDGTGFWTARTRGEVVAIMVHHHHARRQEVTA